MKSKYRITKVVMIGIFLIIPSAIARSGTNITQTPALFKPTVSSAKAYKVFAEEVRSRTVLVDADMLVRLGQEDKFNLNLFEDEMYLALVDRVDRRSEDCATVIGKLSGMVHSSFIFVREKEAVVGIIRTGLPEELHQLRYIGENQHLISQINPALYPPEEDPIPGGTWSVNAIELPPELVDPEMLHNIETQSNDCPSLQPVFDVLLPYTHLARQAMGGTNAAVAQCQLAIAVTNEAYANSSVYARMRLVHCWEVYYWEQGDMSDWLEWLYTHTDIHDIRDTYAADLVSMLVSGGTGLGKCDADASRAYSVVRWDRAVNTWTLGHETGHNIGCAHNILDAVACDGIYSYSYGWHFLGNSYTHWGTVMSYEGIRIPHFSNPDVYFDGQPTGVPIGQVLEAHNAWTIYRRSSTVAGFRTTRFEVWVDFDWGGYERGTYSEPYNTLAEGVSVMVDSPNASEEPALWIKPGSTSETPTLSKPMIIRACGGVAKIGQSP